MKIYLGDVLHVIERNKILFVLLVLGTFLAVALGASLAARIENSTAESNERYTKALHASSAKEFNYIVDTKAANVFAAMTMTADHPVASSMIDGEYMYIESVCEEYTMHTRVVTYTDDEGNTQTEIETYWTWDEVSRSEAHTDTVTVNGRTYPFASFYNIPDTFAGYHYVRSDVRYGFRVTHTLLEGTLYAQIDDEGIKGKMRVFEGMGVEEAYQQSLSSAAFRVTLFWLFWAMVIVVVNTAIFKYISENNTRRKA